MFGGSEGGAPRRARLLMLETTTPAAAEPVASTAAPSPVAALPALAPELGLGLTLLLLSLLLLSLLLLSLLLLLMSALAVVVSLLVVDDVDDVVVVDVMTMVRCPQKSQVLGVRNDKPTSSHHSNVTSKRGYLNDDAGGGHEWYVEC